MRLYTPQHPCYCGIDLPARTLYVCILDPGGEVLGHRPMNTDPDAVLTALAPYRQGLVVAVACLCPWAWLADRCTAEGSPCGLGHALSRTASPGGQANNDTIDSPKIAALLRGARLPPASVSPAPLRAPRALWRRRMPLRPTRAARLAPMQHPNRQENLPAMGTKIAATANCDGGAERFADAAGPKSIAGARALLPDAAALLRAVALPLRTTARPPDAHRLSRLHPVPGLGPMLSLGLLYDIHDLERFPRRQAVVSSCRLGTWSQAAAGKRAGPSGPHIGQAPLTGALSAAVGLFLSEQAAAQQSLAP